MHLAQLVSAKDVVHAITRLPEVQRMPAVALLWSWWHERNRGNHGERRATTEEIQYSVRFHVNEWKDFLNKEPADQMTMHQTLKPPPSDTVKINIDGAYKDQSGNGGWGLICRDASCDVYFAAAGSSQFLSSALHAETTALLDVIALADQMGVGRVHFETDCLVLQ